jgi:hypothetical protein
MGTGRSAAGGKTGRKGIAGFTRNEGAGEEIRASYHKKIFIPAEG